jgi:hypothetical protein
MPPSKNRNLIIFAFYYRPSMASGVQRILRFAKFLPEFGYTPHVICSGAFGTSDLPRVHYVPNEATERVARRLSRALERLQSAVLPYNEDLPWVPHAVAEADELIAREPVAAVISSSPPVAGHLAASRIHARHGIPWLADFRDPILGNPGRPRRWARAYDALLERHILGSCNAALATTDVIVDIWKRRHPKWENKLHTLWNGFDPDDESIQAEPLPPRDHRVLLHAGMVYTLRHPFWLVSSMERLISRGLLDPGKIKLRLLGELQEPEVFAAHPAAASLIARGCLESNNQRVPREEAVREVAQADYLLILDIANLSREAYAVPAKIFDCILMGRPILAYTPTRSPVSRILGGSGLRHAVVYAEDTAEVIDGKLLEFFAHSSSPLPPSDWFLNTFDGRRQAGQVAGYLDEMLSRC